MSYSATPRTARRIMSAERGLPQSGNQVCRAAAVGNSASNKLKLQSVDATRAAGEKAHKPFDASMTKATAKERAAGMR